jgi:NADH:ubiquinone oxidoreductase subunit 3 (subunit A)
MEFFKKNWFQIFMILTISTIIYCLFFKITPGLSKKEETERKLDSLNLSIKKIELEQKKLDTLIMDYNKKIVEYDQNIQKIKSQKTIIKEIYHAKINSVSGYNNNQVDSFFSDRYK